MNILLHRPSVPVRILRPESPPTWTATNSEEKPENPDAVLPLPVFLCQGEELSLHPSAL